MSVATVAHGEPSVAPVLCQLACSMRPIRIFAKVQHVDFRKTVFMDEKMFVLGQTAVDGGNAYVWVGSGNR